MKWTIIVALKLMTCIALNAQNECVLDVTFGDFFRGDTVTCSLEDHVIFEGLILNSDPVLGLTAKDFTVFKTKNKDKIKIFFVYKDDFFSKMKQKKEVFTCKLKNRKYFEFTITMNGNKHKIVIDPNKGKFVFFSKHYNKISVNQHVRSPDLY